MSPRLLTGLVASWVGVAAVGVGAVGCGSDTGVIAEVGWPAATGAVSLATLDVRVGVRRGDGPYVADDEAPLVVDVAGRDLVADPYRLFVEGSGDDPGRIMVIAFGLAEGQVVASGRFATPRAFVSGKVLVDVVPLVVEDGPGVGGDGCVRWIEDGERHALGVAPRDRDCDGDLDGVDCAPDDPSTGPTAPDPCDALDQDCDGRDDEADLDADGVRACEDCDDGDGLRFPGNPEVCDGVDNDCDAACDVDADGDGWSTCGTVSDDRTTCAVVAPPMTGDCDDSDARRAPDEVEVCDGVDNDCDEGCDPGFDGDNDGVSTCGSIVRGRRCLGVVADDCDDGDRRRYPGAPEACDGEDTDCDLAPAPMTCFTTSGGAGCQVGTATCDEGDGSPEITDCVPDGDVTAPTSACTAWNECAAGPAIDAGQCLASSGELAGRQLACVVRVDAAGAPCLPAEIVLPVVSPAPCSQRILGGATQVSFVVTLESGASRGVALDACDASLILLEPLGPTVLEETILVHTSSGAANTILPVVLTPAASPSACVPGATLACTLSDR